MYDITPCCINHPNYADFNYISGNTLTILLGGTKPQTLWFTDTVAGTQRYEAALSAGSFVVWAKALTVDTEESRRVRFETNDESIAAVARDTFRVVGDTIWGAVLQLRHAGEVNITAWQEGDDDYMAVFKERVLRITGIPQTIIFDALPPLKVGEERLLNATAVDALQQATLPVSYELAGADGIAELRGNSVAGLQVGVVRIIARQPGNKDYEPAAPVERELTVWDPDREGLLELLVMQGGVLTPPFTKGVFDYDVHLSCDTARLTLRYELCTVSITTAYGAIALADTTFDIPPTPHYEKAVIRAERTVDNQIWEYTLTLHKPLPKEYIYRHPKFPNRLEVVNNPLALDGKSFNRYQWYRDGLPLPGETKGVLYSGVSDFFTGHLFGVKVYYTEGDSTEICATGIPAGNDAAGLEAYPNPVASYLTVKHPELGTAQNETIEIYNAATGAKAAVYPIRSSDIKEKTAILDLSALPEAAYIVKYGKKTAIVVKKN
jgi:hypothetical protein